MDDGDDTYSAGPAKDIQAIDKASVHRICSGQVVLNLATAVKELVENSIDAGGNNIEIRLKEYGSELLEVIDNGEGVEEANVKGLTLKHHTSKLKDFTDLVNVDTFGFRGEALSSLCALGKMCITTCHKSAKIGTKIEYDNNGKIVKKSPCSRQVGTTVSVEQLFSTLPVRHKEFQRNIKKEFSKMGQVLNAYCIISTGVKIVCTNQTGKGNKNTIVKTSGNTTMRGNLTNVFGSKPVQSLIDFKQLQPGEETCSQFGVKGVEAESSIFRIQGFISTCEHGKGRSSTDRQFYFINKRPCDLTKVSKVVNEAYHMYNRHQYPFVVLDISLNKDAVDVNVTPDKRMVFMQNEKLLLATLKHSLLQMFEPLASQYQMSNLGNQTSIVHFTKSPVKKHSSCPGTTSKRPSVLENLKRSFSSAFAKEDDTSFTSPSQGSQKNTPASKQRKLDSFVSERRSPQSPAIKSETSFSIEILSPTRETIPQSPGADKTFSSSQTSGVSSEGNVTDRSVDVTEHVTDSGNSQSSVGSLAITVIPSPVKSSLKGSTISWESSKANQSEDAVTESDMGVDERFIDNVERRSSEADASELPYHSSGSTSEALTTIAEYDTPVITSDRRERLVSFSLQRLKERFVCRQRNKDEQVLYRNFRAQINPGDNQAAEEELKKEIRKDMFPNMEILGQFNLGFIIVKLGADLFIVDQHATDEKYNFEVLQRSEVLKSQKLIIPRTLELTPMNETILLDNVDIFKTNGFDFIVNDEAPCGQRAKLSSLPMYRNWIFSEQDIEELIFMLTDCPGIMCRPSRVRQMFASRACRTSVMIGTALNKSEMRKLINHMGEIEHPWNCPHGRPTMRHLINLNMIKD